jgi:predicted protein tyrosine phosphatase
MDSSDAPESRLPVCDGVSARSRYLRRLIEESHPPRHPRSFRPTEVFRDLYIGGLRDCSSALMLHVATGARLIVRALATSRDVPPFEVLYLRVPRVPPKTATEERPTSTPPASALAACQPVAPEEDRSEGKTVAAERHSTLEAFLITLLAALRSEQRRSRHAAARLHTTGAVFESRAVGIINLNRADDEPDYDMKQHFPDTVAALDVVWAQCRYPAVVHCAAGVSRSVSVVLACLLRHVVAWDDQQDDAAALAGASPGEEGATLEVAVSGEATGAQNRPGIAQRPTVMDVLRAVQTRRPQARPNVGFMRQLEIWRIATHEHDEVDQRLCSLLTLPPKRHVD